MSITDLNPQYTNGMKAIKRCRDVFDGQSSIQKYNAAGITDYYTMYIPKDQQRYDRVISLSSFTNYTGHTVSKLVGAAFNEDPKSNLSKNTAMAYMIDNCDGGGGDLQQLATSAVLENTIAGRLGLLVNFPVTAGMLHSKEDVARLKLHASIHQYPAETIPNWGVKNGQLSYVVLLENKLNISQDMFSHDSTVGRRVYYIAEDGLCYQQFVEDGDEFLELGGQLVTDFKGAGFTQIPMIIVGSVNNSPGVDKPPISGMADVNISHYQVSVLESENLAIHGQLTLGITSDLSAAEWTKANPNGVSVGANHGYFLGGKGGFHTATAPESSALPAAKAAKVKEIVALGANLIDKNDTARTATEAGINAKEQTSIMMNVVNNVSDAIEKCLEWAEIMEVSNPQGGFQYQISTEFYDSSISAELFTAALGAVDRGMLDTDAQQQLLEQALPTIQFDENSVIAAEEAL